MRIQHKTKKELIQELLELRQENNSLRELYEKGNSLRKYSYDQMLETNLKFTLAMQGGNMAWWEMDVKTGNVTFDKHKVEMLGYSPENFKHYTDFTTLVHPNDYKGIMKAMKDHLDGVLDKYEAEYRILTSSGEYIWFYDYGSVVKKDIDGKPLICTGFVFNITERKNSEKRLLKIMKAIDSTSDAIAISDSKGRHFYQNKALSDLFGYKTAEEVEAAGGGMARVKDKVIAKQMFKNILHGKSWSGELEMVTKSGRVFTAYERANAIKDKEENIIGVIGIITDITERKLAEEKLKESENMLQTVLDNFPGVVFWKDRQSTYLGCNQAFAIGAGLKSNTEIVGKTDHETPWALTEAINYLKDDKDVMECGKGRMHIIESQLQSDGQVIWLDTSKIPLRDSSGQVIGIIGVSHEITTLKNTEQELIVKNKELVFQNEEKEKRAEELIIANKELLFQNEEKENRAAELNVANKELAYQNEEKANRAAELITANKELAYQNREKEKRAVELIIAKDKAEESNRLKTAFLNNISHEIRTPFNGILGLIPLLIDETTTIEEKEEFVNMINFSADRFMNTINDIIEVSQIQSGEVKETLININIHEFINSLINSFKPQFEIKKLEFRVQNNIPKEIKIIHTDSIKLQRILSNLLYNALNFTEEGIIELEANIIKGHITFSVKDTGIGISEKDSKKIFERFVQADVSNTRKYQGSGLGLSIAKVYTEIMGGEIWVESELNIGSTFNFKIPIGIKQ